MSNHLVTVEAIDKVTDCIPVVSTVKNVSIVLYQLAHRVDKSANPVTNTVLDDIKIIALSKNQKYALFCSIPIVGNLAIFALNCLRAVLCYFDKENMNRLDIRSLPHKFSNITSNHSCELAKLYLARERNLSNWEMSTFASNASKSGDVDLFKVFFESKDLWDKKKISDFYNQARNPGIKEYLIKLPAFDEEVAGMCINHAYHFIGADEIVELIKKFPDLSEGSLREVLNNHVNHLQIVEAIFDKTPEISLNLRIYAFIQALKMKRPDCVKWILGKSPSLIKEHLREVFIQLHEFPEEKNYLKGLKVL